MSGQIHVFRLPRMMTHRHHESKMRIACLVSRHRLMWPALNHFLNGKCE